MFKKFGAFSQKSETLRPDSINQLDATTHEQQTVKKEQKSGMASMELRKKIHGGEKNKSVFCEQNKGAKQWPLDEQPGTQDDLHLNQVTIVVSIFKKGKKTKQS